MKLNGRTYQHGIFFVLLLVLSGLSFARAAEPRLDEAGLEEEIRRTLVDQEKRLEEAKNLVASAERSFKAGEYADARRLYTQALALDPASREAQKGLDTVASYLPADPNDPDTVLRRIEDTSRIRTTLQKTEAESLLSVATKALTAAEAVDTEEPTAANLQEAYNQLLKAEEGVKRARIKLAGLSALMETSELNGRASDLEKRVSALQSKVREQQAQVARSSALTQIQNEKQEAEDFRKKQHEKIFESASRHISQKQWEPALAILDQILKDDPSNEKALKMSQETKEASILDRRAKLKDREREERATVLRQIERRAVPQHGSMVYPADWEEVVQRRERTGSSLGQQIPEWKQKILAELQKPITFEFDATPLGDVVKFLSSYTGINFILDLGDAAAPVAEEGAEEGGGGGGDTVTLKVEDMRLDNALRWIMTYTNKDYELRDEAIYVAEKDKLKGNWTTLVYNVSDLRIGVADAPASVLGESGDAESGGSGMASGDEESVTIDAIVMKINPDTWGEGRGSASLMGRNLVIYQTEDMHKLVSQALEQLRAAQAIQVAVTARFLQVDDSAWEEFSSKFGEHTAYDSWGAANTGDPAYGERPLNGIMPQRGMLNGIPAAGGGVATPAFDYAQNSHGAHYTDVRGMVSGQSMGALASVLGTLLQTSPTEGLTAGVHQWGHLGNLETQWLLRMIKRSQVADELFAPHLMVYNNRRAWITIEDIVPITATYSVGSGGGFQPETRSISQGTVLMVRPTVSSDKKYISLDVQLRVQRLVLPVAQSTITFAGTGANLPIDLPVISSQETRTFATLPDGGSILLSGLALNTNARGQGGIPIVTDIPVLGKLFSTRTNQKEKRNFMIILNARMILLDEEEAKLAR